MITKEQEELFNYVRMNMGAPLVIVPITDDQLCVLMEFCVREYQKHMNKFLITQNFAQVYGRNILNENDLAWKLTFRNFDYAKQFSYFFSKNVGLQSHGPYELKKDYFLVEPGKQSYVIPAGRAINSVMYVTPNTTDPALMSGIGGFGGAEGQISGFGGIGAGGWGISGSFGMPGFAMGSYGGAGVGGQFMMPAYDFTLLASDMNMKQKLTGRELVYKITAMESGEHIVHIYGDKFWRSPHLFGKGQQCAIWYTFYDTNDYEDCARKHPEVILSPDQYPITARKYEFMNSNAQQTIQALLAAKAKMVVGYTKGYASGKVKIDDAEMQLEYNMFISDGKAEWEKELQLLDTWLEGLLPKNLLKNQAEWIESLRTIMSGTPLKIYVY
jgi:hypothetical protein